eukprot:Gb_04613 [translate_table: standard]
MKINEKKSRVFNFRYQQRGSFDSNMKYYFAIFLLTIAIPTTSAFSNLLVDGAAFLAFNQGLDSYSQEYLNWTPTDDSPCSWTGVSCYRDGSTVRSLDLSYLRLSGGLTTSLGQLTGLVELDLSYNFLEGEIVPEIGNCSRLKTLLLNHNNFNGSIPVQLSRLKELTNLDLGGIPFRSGSIPFQLSRLKNLEYLGLSGNYLSGRIPKDVLNLPKLQRLLLNDNTLTGTVPEFEEKCPISILRLEGNRLEGNIPHSIGNCVALYDLSVSRNELRGTIPPTLGALTNLSNLSSNNKLKGSIPPELGKCSKITLISLENNHLIGSVPSSFGHLKDLTTLYLFGNQLNGTIPSELGNCSSLSDLQLQVNALQGGIPPELGRLATLTTLDLHSNRLVGSIPSELGRLEGLATLDLHSNRLVGSIPQFAELTGPYNLDLSYNLLSGSIPPMNKMNHLDLSHNKLSGPIPCQLGFTPILNVSYNHLSGILPDWLYYEAHHSPSSFAGNPNLSLDEPNPICLPAADKSGHKLSVGILVGLAFAASGALWLCCGLVYICLRRSNLQKPKMETIEYLPQDLLLKEILEATGDLTEDSVIGQGRHGVVFKLEMPSGKIYAVKKLTFGFMNTSFTLEVETLGSVRHRNLVKIVGFWACQTWGLIIYEYMSNGSLYGLLHEINPPPVLNWEVRYRIALGIAHGLAYLHHDCVPQIIHTDIKSANILIDSDLEPHITDFCLAKPINSEADKDLNSWYAVVGTLGYIAPENGYSTRVDEKSDVYSYGVVLLEVLTRKKAVDSRFEEGEEIVSWVKRRLEERRRNPLDFMDEEMWDWTEKERDEAFKLLKLAMVCIRAKPETRPSMKAIVDELKELKCGSSSSLSRG